MSPRGYYESLAGEGLKSAAEVSLMKLGSAALTGKMLEFYAFGPGGRINDPRLAVNIAGVVFDNPALVGAGWDKKGRALHGLYHLGFGGAEVGTVTPRPQPGNNKPRLWTINSDHSVAINRLGFNSPGVDRVEEYLEAASPLPYKIGINVGKNKNTPNEKAHEDHAIVIQRLGRFASYFALGISSPNTPRIKELQQKGPLEELILSAKEAMLVPVPLFVKIDAERTEEELYDMIDVVLATGADGFIATNTLSDPENKLGVKALYGKRWANQEGGLSGADRAYQDLSTRTLRFIYEKAGNMLTLIAAGGVNGPSAAMDKLVNGASAFQIVTAIRPSWGRVVADTLFGLQARVNQAGAESIREYTGLWTERGPLYPGILSESL